MAFVGLVGWRHAVRPAGRTQSADIWELRMTVNYTVEGHGSWDETFGGRLLAHHERKESKSWQATVIERAKDKDGDSKIIDLGDHDVAETIVSTTVNGTHINTQSSKNRSSAEEYDSTDYGFTAPIKTGGIHFVYSYPGNEMGYPEGGVFEGELATEGTSRTRITQKRVGEDERTDNSTSEAHDQVGVPDTSMFQKKLDNTNIHKSGSGFVVNWSDSKTWRDEHGVDYSANMTVTASIQRMTDIDVIIDPQTYESWIPAPASDDETPGSSIQVVAKVQNRTGRPLTAQQQPRKYTFELVNVSHEPGICLNYPNVRKEDFSKALADLQFAKSKNAAATISGTGNEKAVIASTSTQASAVVSAFDSGGWGSLTVTVELADGSTVQGHLLNAPAATEVLLPKRTNGSHIADGWKEREQSMAPAGAPDLKTLEDSDDSDSRPEGDGTNGDGMTLYEEYRGVRENGHLLRTNPFKKDLFVRDEIGGRTKDGIAMLRGVTNLAIHDEFLDSEFGNEDLNAPFDDKFQDRPYTRTRILNSNHLLGAHNSDQHGLVLSHTSKQLGAALALGRGTRECYDIVIPPDFDPRFEAWSVAQTGVGGMTTDEDGNPYLNGEGGQKVLTDSYASVVAHEMLHGCGVQHHGDHDLWMCQIRRDPANPDRLLMRQVSPAPGGALDASEYEVRATTDDGTLIPASNYLFDRPWQGYVAASNDSQHGGFEDCIMRYDAAWAYRWDAGNVKCVAIVQDNTPVGIQLCESPEGTGVNAPRRDPRPRFGNAQKGRGNCVHKFYIKDRP